MNRKSVSGGLVVAFAAAAAGAVATAPAASAANDPRAHRATCTLTAHAFRGPATGFGRGDRARIKVTFTLRSQGDRTGTNLWRVEIKQNHAQIERRYVLTQDGSLSFVKVARNTYRRDRFTVTATNFRTDQRCSAIAHDPGMKL